MFSWESSTFPEESHSLFLLIAFPWESVKLSCGKLQLSHGKVTQHLGGLLKYRPLSQGRGRVGIASDAAVRKWMRVGGGRDGEEEGPPPPKGDGRCPLAAALVALVLPVFRI
jgi:hypothetical protein